MTLRFPAALRAILLPSAAAGLLATTLLATSCSEDQRVYGSVPPPPIPSVAVTGSPYLYYLYVHCGIGFANFSGHWWQADTPGPEPSAARGYEEAYGTMTLISATHARFQGHGVPTVDFHPYLGTPPACS